MKKVYCDNPSEVLVAIWPQTNNNAYQTMKILEKDFAWIKEVIVLDLHLLRQHKIMLKIYNNLHQLKIYRRRAVAGSTKRPRKLLIPRPDDR